MSKRFKVGDRIRLIDPDPNRRGPNAGTISCVYPEGEYWVDWDSGSDGDAWDGDIELIKEEANVDV